MKNLTSKIIYGIVFGVVIYLTFAFWASADGLKEAFLAFKWIYFPLLLLLALLNYLTRFVKWQYYLKVLKIKIPVSDSFIIFMSGLGLSITPGKVGEVVKSYFLKTGFRQPAAKTAPIVLADRMTDLLALVILSAIGVIGFSYGQKVIWGVSLVLVLLLLAIIIKPIGQRIINLIKRIKFLHRRAESLQTLYDSSYVLLSPKKIIFPILLSLVAWFFEAFAFYYLFVLMDIGRDLLVPIFIYSFSTIVGAVSMLPGGLGTTEGAITGLLKILNIDIGVAALATLAIRVATLWFGVILGIIFLVIAERRYGNQETTNLKAGKIKFLFHIHTQASSDGQMSYWEIINFCRSHQIAAVAITDHNEIKGALELKKLAAGNPRVIIGEEIGTPEGEIIGLFLKDKIAKGTDLKKAILEIKKQGGLVCLPHPTDPIRRSAISQAVLEKIINQVEIVEIFNSRNIIKATDRRSKAIANKYGKAQVVGNDAHLKIELPKAINIIDDFNTQNDFLKSLRSIEYIGRKTNIFIQIWTKFLKRTKKITN